jgi:hypothetical protein
VSGSQALAGLGDANFLTLEPILGLLPKP